MFPMALQALRPTARQRRESGAKGRDHSGTFRPRNRAQDYVLFPQAIRRHPDLWHAGGAPPPRRLTGWGLLPDHPLVSSMSHRIAMPRLHAPAHRGTDPPGVSRTKSPPPPMEGETPASQRIRAQTRSPLSHFPPDHQAGPAQGPPPKNKNRKPLPSKNLRSKAVNIGATGFEPATSCTPKCKVAFYISTYFVG